MKYEQPTSEFKAVFGDTRWHDAFYRFLQNIYRLYPEDRFHTLIKSTSTTAPGDESIYREVQRSLGSIKPFHADLTYALPSLFKQKKEMARQTLELLGDKRDIDGYVEIGSTGRYISELRKHVRVKGPVILVNDVAPGWSPVDIVERGGLAKIGNWVPLADYDPLPHSLPAASFDVVTCYIGLHHIPLPKLDAFMDSVLRIMRPGGMFILRDHDVISSEMNTFVSLAHTVFNAGLGVTWEINQAELRYFRAISEWTEYLASRGLTDSGKRLLQAHDPSDNVLMSFTKASA